MNTKNSHYNVIIIGGGASGTALLYTLARYTNIPSIALVEKYAAFGLVNSNAVNNSQTLHVGDIETNYTVKKVRQVKPAAMMVKYFCDLLPEERRKNIIFSTHKMVVGVGDREVDVLNKRYEELKSIFPALIKINREEILQIEPKVIEGRDVQESIVALYNPEGYAVDFGKLSEALAYEALQAAKDRATVFLNREVIHISKKEGGGYVLNTQEGVMSADAVVVDADAHSLGFAQSLGYGKEFSLIPIAGSFYFTEELLKGKVYTVQDPKLPFAAVHGDPDVRVPGKTRWGPTARFFPVLESRNMSTMYEYFKYSGLSRLETWKSFVTILLQPVRLVYFLKNLLYELPIIGKYFFLGNIRKVAPTASVKNLRRAVGFGGMRLQRVDIKKRELQLGEGKIVGDKILFNMTPSPGASVCLYNAMRDASLLMQFFNGLYSFNTHAMTNELMREEWPFEGEDVSLKQAYPS